MKNEKIACIDIVFLDKEDKPLLLIDGLGGNAFILDEFIQIKIDKMAKSVPYWNGEGDGTFNTIDYIKRFGMN